MLSSVAFRFTALQVLHTIRFAQTAKLRQRLQSWSRSPFVPEDLRTAVWHHTGRKSCRDPGRKPACFERQAGVHGRRGSLELQEGGREVGRGRAEEVGEQEGAGF